MEIQKARIIQKQVRVLLCPCGREHILEHDDRVVGGFSPANRPEQVAPDTDGSPAQRQPHANRKHYHWTPAEDEKLLALWQKGVPYRAMSRIMGRSMKAVECHLRNLTRTPEVAPSPAAVGGLEPARVQVKDVATETGERKTVKDGVSISRLRDEIVRMDDIGVIVTLQSLAQRVGCSPYHASYFLNYEWTVPGSRLKKNFVREKTKVARGWAYRYIPSHVYYNDKAPRR